MARALKTFRTRRDQFQDPDETELMKRKGIYTSTDYNPACRMILII